MRLLGFFLKQQLERLSEQPLGLVFERLLLLLLLLMKLPLGRPLGLILEQERSLTQQLKLLLRFVLARPSPPRRLWPVAPPRPPPGPPRWAGLYTV